MVAILEFKGIVGDLPQDVESAAQFDSTHKNLPGHVRAND